jgi:hypothetical protein
VKYRPQERPAQERRRDVGTTCRLAWAVWAAGDADVTRRVARTAQPAEKARQAAAGFGLSYSYWDTGPRRGGATEFPASAAVR